MTWKNRQKNSDEVELKYLKAVVEANQLWSRDVMLAKFHTAKAQGIAEMAKAWETHCNMADAQHMNCATYFPRCADHKAVKSQCLFYCTKNMECVKQVEAACLAANRGGNAAACNKYESWGPRNGERDCQKQCGLLYAPPGKWKTTPPTGCATVCGVHAGASGKPGTVTCSAGPQMCDPGTKPAIPQCPRTASCVVCFPAGIAKANTGSYESNSKATCNGTLINSPTSFRSGDANYLAIAEHESIPFKGSMAENQVQDSTVAFMCKEFGGYATYGCKDTGQFCSATRCQISAATTPYPDYSAAAGVTAGIIVGIIFCCVACLAGTGVGIYFCIKCQQKKKEKTATSGMPTVCYPRGPDHDAVPEHGQPPARPRVQPRASHGGVKPCLLRH